MKILKKLIIITLVMIMTAFAGFSVYAAEDAYEKPEHMEGKCGDDVLLFDRGELVN